MPNKQYTLTWSDTPTEGTFTLTVDNTGSNPQTTGAIAFDADNATILAALEALSNVAPGDMAVSGTQPKVYEFAGSLANNNTPTLEVDDTGMRVAANTVTPVRVATGANEVTSLPEIFTVSGGDGELVEFSDGAHNGDVSFLSGGEIDEVHAPGGYSVSAGGVGNNSVEFTADAEGAAANMAKTSGGGGTVTVTQQGRDHVAAVAEVDRFTLDDAPNLGSMKYVVNGGSTAPLAAPYSAAAMQTAINDGQVNTWTVGRTGANTVPDPYVFTATRDTTGPQTQLVATEVSMERGVTSTCDVTQEGSSGATGTRGRGQVGMSRGRMVGAC